MAFVFTLTDPAGTATDVTAGDHAIIASSLPDLTRELEDEKGTVSVGDVSVTFKNFDGWFSTQWDTAALDPEDRWDETAGKGIWSLSLSKGGSVVWLGDIDPQSVKFDTKHGQVTATFLGILKRFERFNAENVVRIDNVAFAALTWTTNRLVTPRIITCSVPVSDAAAIAAKVNVGPLDILHATKIKANGHVTGQDLEIMFVGPCVADATLHRKTLTANQIQIKKRLKFDLNANAGVVCTTPGWRNLTFADSVGKILDYCGVLSANRSVNYTAPSPDAVPYLDTKGKNALDALTELSLPVGACLFRTPATTYFQGRDIAKAGVTPKNVDALVMEESWSPLWTLFRYLCTVKSNIKERTRRRGGLVYPKNEMELSTDYTDDTSTLQTWADRLYAWFGQRRKTCEWILKDDGTAYQIWDSLVRTIGGTATTFFVTSVAEPLRAVDSAARSSVTVKVVAALGTAPSTGDGQTDDQYVDDLPPEPPDPVEIYKVGQGEPAEFRALYPKDKYPNKVPGTPVLVGNTLTVPMRHLMCIRFKWDNDDSNGRLLGFHLTKCHEDGDLGNVISEDRCMDLQPAADGWFYFAPRANGNGGPTYISSGKKRTYFIQTVYEDGPVSAQSDELDSWLTGSVDDTPPDGGCYYLSANGTTGGLYRLLGGVWTLLTGIRAMDLGSYYAITRGRQSGYLLVQTYPVAYAQSAAWSKSVDGLTWSELIPPSGYVFPTPSGPSVPFAYLAVSPADDAYILAEAYVSGLANYTTFLSPDRGQSWTPGYTLVGQMWRYLVGSPADPLTWYGVSDDGHLRHTVDGGASWTDHGAVTCLRIIAHPYAPGTIIKVGTGVMAISPDYGATWAASIYPTAGPGAIYDLAIDPSDPEHWIAVAREGSKAVIYNSASGLATASASWVAVSGLTDKAFYQVQFDPTDPLKVYAAGAEYSSSQDVLYLSPDGGLTWAANNPPSTWEGTKMRFDILAVPGSGTTPPQDGVPIYGLGYDAATTTRSLWRSTDRGETWTKVWSDSSVTMGGPWTFLARETGDASGLTIYKADEGTAVKVTVDGGESFARWLALDVAHANWNKILLPASSAAGYVSTHSGKLFRTLTRTNEFPNDWLNIPPAGVTVVSAALDAATPTTLYVLGSDGKVYTSTTATSLPPTWDAGQATGFSAGNAQEIICPAAGVLWVVGTRQTIGGTSTCIRKSVDGGATFTTPTDPDASITALGIQQIYVDGSGNVFVLSAAGHFGIWRSTDGGSTWTAVYGGGTDVSQKCYSIAAIPGVTGGLFAGRQVGLLKSTDGGATWAGAGDTGDTAKKFLSVC